MIATTSSQYTSLEARLRNRGERAAWGKFASEWNLNFLSGSGPDRWYEGIGERKEELSSRGVTFALVYADRKGAGGMKVAGWIPRRVLPTLQIPVPARMRAFHWHEPVDFEAIE